MKKLFLILLTVVLVGGLTANAQDYKTAIGVRGGLANGLTVKHFISNNVAVEGIVSSRWQGFSVTGLYEIHKQAFKTDRLNWYYGAGGHVGFWDGSNVDWSSNNDSYTVIGVDGILGIEYNIKDIPINISLDWKPTLNIVGYSGFWGDGGALSVRYIF
ncbi:MAG: hypothetical protein DRJ01_05675 [Bacteroidetes bacterium]|nr:MAG: hypothetical protein DRJ01_05675 [Bacteroidota bacterium]